MQLSRTALRQIDSAPRSRRGSASPAPRVYLLHAQRPPGLSRMGWGSNWTPCFRSTKPSVLRVRADCGGRLFTAKLAVVAHIWRIRCPIQLLANDAILLTCQFCDCLRDRVDDFIRFIGIDFV